MKTEKILIVDDEETVRTTLQRVFESQGYTVVTAGDAKEAKAVLDRETDIQVMFTDLKMPGQSGVELCRELRRDYPIACIYAMSGFTSLFDLAACREAGFDDYFTKPIALDTLRKAAKDAFEKLERWRKF